MARTFGIMVEILGDSRGLERAFARSSKSAKQFGVGVSGIGRSLAGLTAGFAGVAGATSLIRTAFQEMADRQRATAQTAAVLKSTGAVAGITAEQVDQLAESLSRLSGADDEAVQAGENLLLTFPQIRNVAGETNDIFNQATLAALDLSVAMNKDMSNAALQVGKALNDPARGYARLQRIGVAFTQQQVQQIKTMTAAGNVIGAQKVILAELTKEFGGSAKAAGKTLPGQFAILRETIKNTAGDLAERLSPQLSVIVTRLSDWIHNTRNVARIQATFNTIVATAGALFSTTADAISRFVGAVGGWGNALTILVGAWAGFKLAGVVSATAVMTANIVAAGVVKSAWQAALISTGFGALAVAAGIAATYTITHWEKVKGWFADFWGWLELTANQVALKVVEPFSHIPSDKLGGWARDLKRDIQMNMAAIEAEAAARAGDAGEKSGESFAERYERELREALAKLGKGGTATPPGGLKTTTGARGLTPNERAARRNQWFDAGIARKMDRLQDLGLRKQLAGLRAIEQEVRARRSVTKDKTRQLALDDELLKIQREQRSVMEQIATANKAAVAAARQRRQTQLFRTLGFGPGGEDLVPGVGALQRRLARVGRDLAGTALGKKLRSQLAAIRKVLADEFTKTDKELRSKIEEMLAGIDRQLKEHRGRRLARFRVVDPDQILRGLGLDPAAERALRDRLARLGPGGTIPAAGRAAFGMPVAGMVVNLYGDVITPDSNKFIRDMQKKAGKTRAQQRGARPGVALGGA